MARMAMASPDDGAGDGTGEEATTPRGGTPAPPASAPRPAQGTGEKALPGLYTERVEARLALRALQQGWPVTPEQRALAMQRAQQLMESDSHKDWAIGIKLSIHADGVNVSRERIQSQERTTADRTQVEAMMAIMAALSPAERAQLDSLTLRAQAPCLDSPPGGFITGAEGQEGVQPPVAATEISDPPASLTPPASEAENG